MALVNPVVEVLDGEEVCRPEGCLSLPGLSENVNRVEHIRLTWTDENMQSHTEEIGGFLARIVQHECDHLVPAYLRRGKATPVRSIHRLKHIGYQLLQLRIIHGIHRRRLRTEHRVPVEPCGRHNRGQADDYGRRAVGVDGLYRAVRAVARACSAGHARSFL